jgi:hypothetical protein
MTRPVAIALLFAGFATGRLVAQRPDKAYAPGEQGSRNVKIQFHIPSTGSSDLRIDQDPSRPYVYQAHGRPAGFHIVSVKDPARASIIYSWQIENADLVQGGASGVMLFKHRSRNYAILSVQFRGTGPMQDVVGIVFDVTGLPDTTKVREVGRIRDSLHLGGSHEAFTYKHSDGRPIFFTTVANPARFAHMYDLEKFLAAPTQSALIGPVPEPEDIKPTFNFFVGYHDMYAAYDPATHQDKFYGAGWAGYFLYDVSKPTDPKLITTITGVAGVDLGHTFMADPTGRYAVVETETQYQPIRLFDLKPGLDGQVKTISRPIGAWSPNWQNLVHQFEIRWPYVFASSYADGLQVFNMMDPTNPYTVGYYDTYDRQTLDNVQGNNPYPGANSVYTGSFGVDIRNADGLIVTSDMRTGIWGFRMEGFDGWNGHQWGMPNISSVQDWDNGPDGAPKPQRVSIQ